MGCSDVCLHRLMYDGKTSKLFCAIIVSEEDGLVDCFFHSNSSL